MHSKDVNFPIKDLLLEVELEFYLKVLKADSPQWDQQLGPHESGPSEQREVHCSISFTGIQHLGYRAVVLD